MDANRSKLSRHSSKDTLQKASSSDRLSPQHLKSSASKIRSLRNDNFVGSMSSVLDLNQDLESNVLKNRKEYSTDSLGNLDKSTQNFEKASEKRREKRDKRERKSKESRVKLDQNAIEIVNPSTSNFN